MFNTLRDIINIPTPQKTNSYTPISHKQVIETVDELLTMNNFDILDKSYRANNNANVMNAKYQIRFGNDSELTMMAAFMNSYDKTATFKFCLGAQVICCSNGLVFGDMGAIKRKHTGVADTLVFDQIRAILGEADNTFSKLIHAKEQMKNVSLYQHEQAQYAGKMFIQDDVLSATEIGIVKREINTPSYDYNTNNSTLWDLYNHCTHAYKEANPTLWLKKHIELSDWVINEFGILEQVKEEELVFID